MTAYLARIDLFPIKSLDGLSVQQAQVLASGALQHDRAFALMDKRGQYVNGKRDRKIHQVRSRFSDDITKVTVWVDQSVPTATFHLNESRADLEKWFGDYFHRPITLQHNSAMGFPDDTDSPGPTLVSTATLQTVGDWFGLTLAETRRRFRSNLEIDGVPAFWEDCLVSASGQSVNFSIGAVIFQGINPCKRCVVPTRDTQTGEVTRNFQQHFVKQRAVTLPKALARSRFNPLYRLAINTRVAPGLKATNLTVGDALSLC
jgi:hypothetical protein